MERGRCHYAWSRPQKKSSVSICPAEMIEQANDKKPHGSSTEFEQADLVQLSLDEQFDVIVSFLDVLNYITEKDQVKESFRR